MTAIINFKSHVLYGKCKKLHCGTTWAASAWRSRLVEGHLKIMYIYIYIYKKKAYKWSIHVWWVPGAFTRRLAMKCSPCTTVALFIIHVSCHMVNKIWNICVHYDDYLYVVVMPTNRSCLSKWLLKPHYVRISSFCYWAPPKVVECISLLHHCRKYKYSLWDP